MRSTGLEVIITTGKRTGSLDALIVDLVPTLVETLACHEWYCDRDPTLPDHWLRVRLATPAVRVSSAYVESTCYASLRRLASGAEIYDSRLIVMPHAELPDHDNVTPHVRVSAFEWIAGDMPSLHQWSSEYMLRVLPRALSGEVDRKTLAPPLIGTLIEAHGAGGNSDRQQWLSAAVDHQLSKVTLENDGAGRSIRRFFDEKLATLAAAGSLRLRRDLQSVAPYGDHLARLRHSWLNAIGHASLADDELEDLLVRHLSRLGFTQLEACYLLLLSMAEFS